VIDKNFMKNSIIHKQFGINVFSNVTVYALFLAIGLWFTPYLIRNLGVAAYGLIPLASSVSSYLSLITLSINGAVGRFLAIDIQNHNSEGANVTFNTALAGLLTIAIVTLPILIGLVPFVPRVFNIPSGSETASKKLFLLVMFSFFVGEVDTCFGVSSWAKSRFDLRNIVAITSNIIRILVVVVLFSFLKPSVSYVGSGMLLAALVGLAGDFILWRILTPDLRVSPRKFDRTRVRELFGMGGWVVVNQIGTLLFLNIDLIVANRVLGAKLAGEYGSILLFSTLLRGIAGAVSSVLYPTIVAKYAQNDLKSVHKLSARAVRLMGIIVALPVGLLCGLGSPFLRLWLGPSFGSLGLLLILMVWHLPINLAVLPLFGIQMAMNKVKMPGMVTLIMGVGNLALAIIFTSVFRWGPYGIAAAAAVALTLKNAIFTPIYSAYIQKIPWYTYIQSTVPGAVFAIGIGASSFFVSNSLSINSWLSFILIGSILGIISIVMIYFLGLTAEDKSFILGYLPEVKK
jgi:O-antigen/teichoic acid export membrane protein